MFLVHLIVLVGVLGLIYLSSLDFKFSHVDWRQYNFIFPVFKLGWGHIFMISDDTSHL